METVGASSRTSAVNRWHLLAVLGRHPLIGFFALAYGYSAMELIVLHVLGVAGPLVIALFIPGPTQAAVTMTTVMNGTWRPRRAHRTTYVERWRADRGDHEKFRSRPHKLGIGAAN